MWEDMWLKGDDGWLNAAIRENTLVAVMDGLYMRALYPNMNSCAFILYARKGAAASRELSQSKQWWHAPTVVNSLG
jgi:hypothetical protein